MKGVLFTDIDLAVFEILGLNKADYDCLPSFCTDWSAGGPVIEQFRITTWFDEIGMPNDPRQWWKAEVSVPSYGLRNCYEATGETLLVAAMKALCLSRGIELPETDL
jgi:hypothetical protein